ncbi:MAG: long-chain fatty acid--CoA ligase [Deltaproteobacteria bacterium]|nr:long-chain fatty acid--CoA ligase [Deltaproteobacteria bacterium]
MEALYARVLAYVADRRAEEFGPLALAVFAHQFEHNEVYRRFCLSRQRRPETVERWEDIPAVPIVAFKRASLRCGPAQRTFRSSGTTAGPQQRSRHELPEPRLYQAAALAGLRRFMFPDVERMRIVSLIAPVDVLPDSSLAQMVAWGLEQFGGDQHGYAAGRDGLDLEALVAALRASERDGRPLAILATTGGLIRALDALAARRLAFRLPHGSRLMDTGGDKGAPRPLSRNGLLHAVWSGLAIPGYFCVNEYGMAELSSQFYDSVIADRVAGRHAARRLLGPHWVRTRLLDPQTLQPVAAGQPGLLCHLDLANAGTVAAVLCEDLAVALADGLRLLGRAPGAELRGCSLQELPS